uniref:NADH dehydrogenase subunit 6 n=1 Tax=Microthoracius praelongiceps TaxID=1958934 RepID=A0A1S5XVS8_9NEOP|nr:NADH dehydrogenase subunit 6 [Microthoracius praelongiceps]
MNWLLIFLNTFIISMMWVENDPVRMVILLLVFSIVNFVKLFYNSMSDWIPFLFGLSVIGGLVVFIGYTIMMVPKFGKHNPPKVWIVFSMTITILLNVSVNVKNVPWDSVQIVELSSLGWSPMSDAPRIWGLILMLTILFLMLFVVDFMSNTGGKKCP